MLATPSSDLLVVLGTRPEIIKLAPVIRTLESRDDLSVRLLHTGQHYDNELSGVFFDTLKLPQPDRTLDIGSGTQGEQTGAALRGIEADLRATGLTAVLALGDTNAVLSAALAASKTDAEFAHLEAGIRSFDRSMPEEINRVVADQLADVAFAPTETGVENLAQEGITEDVYLVGNTVVDACREHIQIARDRSTILNDLGLTPGEYAVATVHRQRNTDSTGRLRTIVETLDDCMFPVVFPAHPRTTNALDELGFEPSGSLILADPLDYLDFLNLLGNSRVVVTDSGGIQEEASILEVPCLTVRPNTERPETVEAGVNELLAPSELGARLATVFRDDDVHGSMTGRPDLYGDGDSSERIVDILVGHYA